MIRSLRPWAAVALLAGCEPARPAAPAEAPPPEARTEAPLPEPPPVAPAPPQAKLRGYLTVDAEPLSEAAFDDEATIAATARGKLRELLACVRPAPAKSTDVWLVARVDDSGRVAWTAAAPDVPAEEASCASGVLRSLAFQEKKPFALGLVLRAEPAPSDCKGDACDAIPLAKSNADADTIGDAFGYGGLGMVGTGEGGGGRGEGIGLGSIGTIGHGSALGNGGSNGGHLGGAHKTKPPSIRMGKTTVVGSLPPEVIQRIVRMNFGRFRLCYENGLRTDPNLQGTVTVDFVIGIDGSVTSATGGGLGKVGECVRKAFFGLSFPPPDANLTVSGKKLGDVTADVAADRLRSKGWRALAVAGAAPEDPFVVFAIKKDRSMDPTEDDAHGFLVSVRRMPSRAFGDRADVMQFSDGFTLAFEGADAEALSGDLAEANGPTAVVKVTYPIAFSPGG